MRHMLSASRLAVAAGLVFAATAVQAVPTFQIDTVMTGLVTPRGLAFGPDGALYVTEAGNGSGGASGPSLTTANNRPMYMGYSGAVSRLDAAGQTRVLSGLPSLGTATGTDVSGLQDIVFGNGQAYGVFGLGSSPAKRDALGAFGAPLFGSVVGLKLDGSGSVTKIADIAAHEAAYDPGGGGIDANPYGLARTAGGDFIVADAGANTFLKATLGGVVATLGVLPPKPNPLPFGPPVFQSVPTAAAIGPAGNAVIGTLTGFPFPVGKAGVFSHDFASGATTEAYAGFTTIIDLDFDAVGNLYVLQISANGLAAPGGPGSGVLIKLAPDGTRTTLLDAGLVSPGGIAIEETGSHWGPTLYVSTHTSMPAGGTVLRITPVPEPATYAMLLAGIAALTLVARRRRA